MIIAKQKPFQEILAAIGEAENVYIVGCGECATLTATGGEKEALEMKERLEALGKRVVAIDIPHSVCQELDVGRIFRANPEAVEEADVFLVLSCGAGTQSVAEVTEKRVIAGTDSMFLGNVKRHFDYEEKCTLCGECVIDKFGGICPVARCAKGLLNGPCGGANHGRCEVYPERACAWTLIYKHLEAQNRLEDMRIIHPPRRWDEARRPGAVVWRDEKQKERRRTGE